MTRLAAALVVAVLGAACNEKTGHSPKTVHQLAFPATSLSRVELPDGTSKHSTLAIFLPATIAQAPRVYLELEDVRLEPGSEIDVYLAPPDGSSLEVRHLIQTLTAEPGKPVTLPVVAHEVVDFESQGARHTPRTTLRGLAGVGFALHVKKGSIQAQRLVLSTASAAERAAAAKRAP